MMAMQYGHLSVRKLAETEIVLCSFNLLVVRCWQQKLVYGCVVYRVML